MKIITKWSIFWSKIIMCFDWCFHLNISLFYSFCNFCSLTWHLLFRIFICTGWSISQNISQKSKHLINLLPKILHILMIFKVGLPSLNAFFSGSKSPNDKVSVLLRKRITSRFQKSSYFWFWSHFCWCYSCLKHRGVFFGTPCIYIISSHRKPSQNI